MPKARSWSRVGFSRRKPIVKDWGLPVASHAGAVSHLYPLTGPRGRTTDTVLPTADRLMRGLKPFHSQPGTTQQPKQASCHSGVGVRATRSRGLHPGGTLFVRLHPVQERTARKGGGPVRASFLIGDDGISGLAQEATAFSV